MPTGQPAHRYVVPDPASNQAIQDLYDRVAALANPAPAAPAPAAISTTVAVAQTVVSITGATGTAANPQYALIPRLPLLPSNNPSMGAPYAQNGILIEVNSQFWRYAGAPTYAWEEAGTATAILADTHANRVANYSPATYPNALFLESDTLLLLESNSIIWRTIAGIVRDTHANRLSMWPSVQFSAGTAFYETDRTAAYISATSSGTVTTTGTSVAWVSGDHFINTGTGFTTAQWPAGTAIIINGVSYPLASIASDIALTLSASAGIQTGVAYSVVSGKWIYQSGTFSSALANLPTDLGENDTTLVSGKVSLGFKFFENDTYFHQLQWNVSAWQRGPDDPEHSDIFQYFGSAPTDGGWAPCDGSTGVKYLKYDGTLGTRDLPNTNGTAAFPKASAAYSATIHSATAPTLAMNSYTPAGTISALTFTGSTLTPSGTVSSGFTGSPQTFTTLPALAGAGINAFIAPNPYTPAGFVISTFTGTPFTPAGTVSTPTFAGTPAILTGVISLPADPVAWFAAILMYRQ